jgi:hypothetical protein
MNTAGTNVVLKLCSSNGDTVCNSGVDEFRDCEGSEFTLRDGSPEFIYPGGNTGTDGGNVEGDKSEDAGSVEDPADSTNEVGVTLSLLLCFLVLFVSCCCFHPCLALQRVLVVVVALPLFSFPSSLTTPRPFPFYSLLTLFPTLL